MSIAQTHFTELSIAAVEADAQFDPSIGLQGSRGGIVLKGRDPHADDRHTTHV